ncbi:MAG: hypothetical protein ABFS16_13780 [Bacteroidota bacterium]
MKTRNNVQKAITKSLAVLISLVLISITVNAQNFWKTVLENNSFSQIAMAMTVKTEASPASADANSTTEASAYAEMLAVETEEALELEDWMVNENNFFLTLFVETEVESELEMEEWMTSDRLFDVYASYLEVEAEEALEVEEWMLNEDKFGVKSVEITEENEEGLELESWMTDKKVWKI